MKLLEKIKKKFSKRKPKPAYQLVVDFYTMLRHYDRNSRNIAVFRNRRTFDEIVKTYNSRVVPKRDDQVLKLTDNKYLFIIAEIETTIMFVEDLYEFDDCLLKFGRYI